MTKLSKQKRSRKSKLDSVKSKKSSKLSRKSSKKKSRRSKKSSVKSRISKKSSKKSRRKSKRSSRKSKKTEAKTSELNCGIEKSECEKPKYKRAEIDKLAEKCGVDYTKYKNKKSLCEAIFKKFKEQKTASVETESESEPETESENCSDDLKKKSIAELKSRLDNIGFEKNKPTKKSDMIEYICSEKKNGSCDIENEKYCEGDLVCDASNPTGICISKELADSRKLNEIVYNGKRIIGSKVAINKLQKFLDTKGPSVEEPSVEATDESESETEDYDSCYNDLKNKSINELKSMLDNIGFEKNKPTKKFDMVGYLCSEKVNGSCDIENEKYCGEGLVCDSSNPKGICISDELAKNRKFDEFIYNGNKIIGSKNVIKNLQSTLSKPPSKPEEVVEEPQEELPTFDEVTEDIKKNVEGDIITKKPKKKEGTKIITELDDIDEILEKIQENNEDINISGVQREILKCLGLMAN